MKSLWLGRLLVLGCALAVPEITAGQQGAISFVGTLTTRGNPSAEDVRGVAADTAGNIYTSEQQANRVMRISPNGTSQQLPIPGINYAAGIATDSAGDLFVVGSGSTVARVPNGSTVGAPVANISGLVNASAIALDSNGNMYVADCGAKRVYFFPGNGVIYLPSASQRSWPTPGCPGSVAVDKRGNIYYTLGQTKDVFKLPATAGAVPAGAQPVSIGTFGLPVGLAFSGADDLLVADSEGPFGAVIMKISNLNNRPTTSVLFRGTGMSGFSEPAIAVAPSGIIYFTAKSTKVLVIDPRQPVDFGKQSVGVRDGQTQLTLLLNFNSTPAVQGPYISPAINPNGPDFFDATTGTCRQHLTPRDGAACTLDLIFRPAQFGIRNGTVQVSTGTFSSLTIQLTGQGAVVETTAITGLDHPLAMGSDVSGGVWVADTVNRTIKAVTASGSFDTLSLSLFGSFVIDKNGSLYYADMINNKVKKWTAGSVVDIGVKGTFWGPRAVALDSAGNVYVADSNNGQIKMIDSALNVTVKVGQTATSFPTSVAVDADNNIFYADNGIVKKQSSSGSVDTIMGVSGVYGIALDQAGNLYAADADAKKLWVIPKGSTQPIDLGGTFNVPIGVAVSGNQDVYVADTVDGTVHKFVLTSVGLTSIR